MDSGETIILTDLVEKYTEDLFSWALYKVSDQELARDLVQDTFLAAAEQQASFRGKSSPKTWLFSILNNKIIDVYRKKVKQPIVNESDVFAKFFDPHGDWKPQERPENWNDDEQHLLDNTEFQQVLQECLKELPEKWGIAVKSKYLLNKKGDEICQELGITSTNFWQIVHRAKLQLRECVEVNWFKN